MEAWVVWLIIAGFLAVAEVLTFSFGLGLLAVAAVAAGVASAAGLPVGVQVIVFGVASVAGLGVVRPLAVRHLRQPPALRSGAAALVGREAVALTQVTRHSGLVRIGGEEWSARPFAPDLDVVIPEGASVDVLAIEGATALVHPREEPLWTTL
jgi:membrane protein implicated in regulation of membrane protease activity